MGAFAEFLEKHKIKPEALVRASARLERGTAADEVALAARAKAREDKKSYAELNIAKPASGRGVSLVKINDALADRPLAKRVRTKLLRAARLITKVEGVAAKDLFGAGARKKGLRRIAEAGKKAKAKKP